MVGAQGPDLQRGQTRIVTLDEGFDFLGFNARRYRGILLIKPSKAALRRIRERLRTEVRSLRGSNAAAVIAALNPIVRGWAAYYRTVVSSEEFAALDHYMWKLTYKWAKHSHPNKSTRWVTRRYFGLFHRSRRDRWVFGDRDSGAYLQRFAWTRIVRHPVVKGTASTDDPALTGYWASRRRNGTRRGPDRTRLRLLHQQHGRCPLCGELLLHADHPPQTPPEWEQWLAATRKAITKHSIALRDGGAPDDLRLIHARCHRRKPAHGNDPALLSASQPQGFA